MKHGCVLKLFLLVYISLITLSPIKIRQELLDSINSATVAFVYSNDKLQSFFQNPTRAYISGYFYFEDDLAADIIFGLDLEWMEGIDKPVHFSGADWMCLAGISRYGVLSFPTGSPEDVKGKSTSPEKWATKDLKINLQPKKWYKMRIEADFSKLEFISFSVQGNGINITENISGNRLTYPNYVPFDRPSLSFYTFALRSKEFSPMNDGNAKIYFDDIEGGIYNGSDYDIIFSNGFEDQTKISIVPVSLPVSPIQDISEKLWYHENEDAKIKITDVHCRSGSKSILCDADLTKTKLERKVNSGDSEEDWLTVETKHLYIHYKKGTHAEENIKTAENEYENTYEWIKKTVPFKLSSKKIHCYLHEKLDKWGYAERAKRSVHYVYSKDMKLTSGHEMMHIYLSEFNEDMPQRFEEGLCRSYEVRSKRGKDGKIYSCELYRLSKLMPLKKLTTKEVFSDWYETDGEGNTAAAYVYFLKNLIGEKKFWEFYEKVDKDNFETKLRDFTNLTSAELDKKFATFINGLKDPPEAFKS
ncbi:MAG: hypothetical protein HY606_14430 [Planctomycetes bacterium]|nr:hypothetical protein [Planctomycetota bacterium]